MHTSVPLYLYNLTCTCTSYGTCYVMCLLFFSQTIGVTTTLPDEVPSLLPFDGASNNEWYYRGNNLYHNYSHTKYFYLPTLNDLKVGNKVGLLLLPNGELHLFLDGKNPIKLASGLPVHKSLFGAVDVCFKCTKIKSEILSGEFVYVDVHITCRHMDVHLSTIGMKWTLYYFYL